MQKGGEQHERSEMRNQGAWAQAAVVFVFGSWGGKHLCCLDVGAGAVPLGTGHHDVPSRLSCSKGPLLSLGIPHAGEGEAALSTPSLTRISATLKQH